MRRFVAFITNLPPDSAVHRKLNSNWSDDRELAAAQVELAHAVFRATLASGGVKRLPKPLRVPRPAPYTGLDPMPAKRPVASEEDVLNFFAATAPRR